MVMTRHCPWWPPSRRCVCFVALMFLALHLVVNPNALLSRKSLNQAHRIDGALVRPAAAVPPPSHSEQRDDVHVGVREDILPEPLLVDTPGCRIPDMSANSSEVAAFVFDYDMGGACDDPPPLVRSTDTSLFVDTDALAAYGARGPDDVQCCYSAMWRVEPDVTVADWGQGVTQPPPKLRKGPLYDKVSYGNDIHFGTTCEPFFGPTVVPFEFVRVNCTVSSPSARVSRHRDYHAFVPVKQPRGWGPAEDTARTQQSEDALSVLLVGVDSVSRLNFIRTMPRTRAFLEQHLGLRPMLGYTKVGENTFPNLVPLLSGLSVPELRRTCWGDVPGANNNAHFDACPWVWKDLNREGYVNMFAEDTAWMGLFHYLKRGFLHQPTDYDPRPLLYFGEKDLGRKLHLKGTTVCIGQRTELDVLFDYGLKFSRVMQRLRRKSFGIVWGTSLSHDDLNSPTAADSAYERFLRDVLDTGLLNSTVLVFMSDHGLRFGDILKTRQGRLEGNLPLMYVALPEWVRQRYPQAARNLEHNTQRLVTVYDLHATLYDLMNLTSLRKLEVESVPTPSSPPPRGISLFSRVPAERTCENAGIPKHFCACQTLNEVPVDDFRAFQVAEFILSEVNALLQKKKPHADSKDITHVCARLKLDAIQDVRSGPLQPPSSRGIALEHVYELAVRAKPGGALFSATVLYRVGSTSMKLDGGISRINRYGDQAWCESDFKLRPLCYCVSASSQKRELLT